MIKSLNRPDFLPKYQEFFLFVGLWLWLGIYHVLEGPSYTWVAYLGALLIPGIVQLPGLFFSLYKTHFKETLSRKRYIGYWLVCFLIFLPALTACCIWFTKAFEPVFLITVAVCSFTLELLLIVNNYYRQQVKRIKWIKKIGLENAVLISIILLALTLSAMAASSLNNPAYDKNDQLLIGFEFKPLQILHYFGTFFSFFVQFLVIYMSGYLFFFINSRFLVPKILKQSGLLIYVLSLLTVVALLYPVIGQLLILLPINQTFGRDLFSGNVFIMENAFGAVAIMLLSLPVVLSLQWAKLSTRVVALEGEKSQTELDLLKQQLNPHFFFNTLNNLYALSLQKSEKTSESILQLSELMRYVIYKGQEDQAAIAQELKYIEDYIQLQQIRLKKPLRFNFAQEITNDQLTIAPLLLIVLIENAFKHGIEPAEDEATLDLLLRADDKMLYFRCENSFEADQSKTTGIGLNNLRRRLALLYPGKHSLKITVENHIFKAELELRLT